MSAVVPRDLAGGSRRCAIREGRVAVGVVGVAVVQAGTGPAVRVVAEPRSVGSGLFDVDHVEILSETALPTSAACHVDFVSVVSGSPDDPRGPPSRGELGVDGSLGEVSDQYWFAGLEVSVAGARGVVMPSCLFLLFMLDVLVGKLAAVDDVLHPTGQLGVRGLV